MQLAKMESAVKTMHSVANEQAAKYRGDMKKVKFGSYYVLMVYVTYDALHTTHMVNKSTTLISNIL